MEETRDIAPELLEKLQEEFQKAYEGSGTVKRLLALVEAGNGTYADANDYAIEVGELLAGVFERHLSSDVLPDGRMYYNIAQRILEPLLKNNYEMAADAATQVQQALNEKTLRAGLKAVTPKPNEDRINGIIDIVSGKENFDDIAYMLQEPVINFTQSAVDDTVRENVNFQGKSGLMPKVVRKVAGKCCDWCSNLAGTYTYPDVPRDVYRRHKHCRCTVEYDPGNGKKQNVHTKQWQNPEIDDKIENRKVLGRKVRFRAANMSADEYARAKELWQKNKEVEGLSQREKEHVYEELDNNLTAEEKESCIVRRPIGNHEYTAINMGHNQYKIIMKKPLSEGTGASLMDEVLDAVLEFDWRSLL